MALGDTQTPDDHNLPTGTVLATGDIFVDNEALGFYDLVPLDLDGMPFSGSGNAFRFHVFPARRWRYDGADWVLDATIAFNGTNLGDTHIDSDLTVWTPLWNSTTWLVEWVEIENVELSDVPTASITVDTLAAGASPTVTGSADGDIFISTYDYPHPTMPVTANIVAGDPPITAFNFDHRYWRWDSTNLEWVFQQWLFGVPQTYDNFLTIMNEALDGVATAVWYDSEDFTYPYIFVLCNEIGINVSISLRDLNSRDIPGIRAFRDFQARRWHDESGGPHGEFNDYGGRWTSYAPSYGSGSIDVYTGDWSRVGVVSADDQSVLWQFEKDTDNPTDRNFPIIHETRLSTVDMHGNAQMIDDFVIGAEVAASSLGLGSTVDELNQRTAAIEAGQIVQDGRIHDLELDVTGGAILGPAIVSLEAVKQELRIPEDDTTQDALLNRHIQAATDWVIRHTDVPLQRTTQTISVYRPITENPMCIELPNITDVSNIHYWPCDSTLRVEPPNQITLADLGRQGYSDGEQVYYIYPPEDGWPQILGFSTFEVAIAQRVDPVPVGLIQTVILGVRQLYEGHDEISPDHAMNVLMSPFIDYDG